LSDVSIPLLAKAKFACICAGVKLIARLKPIVPLYYSAVCLFLQKPDKVYSRYTGDIEEKYSCM
jgi:hypothetical protein